MVLEQLWSKLVTLVVKSVFFWVRMLVEHHTKCTKIKVADHSFLKEAVRIIARKKLARAPIIQTAHGGHANPRTASSSMASRCTQLH